MNNDWHVCSLVVQVKPEQVETVMRALEQIPGTEIPAHSKAEGKLVVIMHSSDADSLLEKIESAREIMGVLAVSLVYHQQDVQEQQDEVRP